VATIIDRQPQASGEGGGSGPAGAAGAAALEERSPELAERLFEILLCSVDLDGGKLDVEMRRLEREHGEAAYAELIYLLSSLRFEPQEAHGHWQAILEHGEELHGRLGTFVDCRVSMVSYFVHANRRLEHPRIVELRIFERTRKSAFRDELTGLHNDRFFAEFLDCEIRRARRTGAPLSVVMADLDDLKPINERFDHEAGNEALSAAAQVFQHSIRPEDFAARYSGEEFVLILPGTPKTGARIVAERARVEIERLSLPCGPLTASLGIATYPADAATAADLVRCADRALYAAKNAGKNQVEMYGQCRRSYRRVPATLHGTIRRLTEATASFETINVSEGGVRVVTDADLPVGCLVEVSLALPDGGPGLTTAARTVDTAPHREGGFEAAFRFVDIPLGERSRLSDIVSTLQEPLSDPMPDPCG